MRLWIVLLLVFCSACVTLVKTGDVVDSTKGMVVCVDEIAAEVGAKVLDKGGNAVDAAVAVAFALAVTHPQAGNLGGGGFMLIRNVDDEITSIDYRERAPMAAAADMFLGPDGTVDEDKSRYGFLASGTPGTVAGMYLAHTRYGRLPWYELLEPACELAENGFRVNVALSTAFKKHQDDLSRFPATIDAYFKGDGTAPDVGYRLALPDLAKTLRAVQSNGHDGFYKGDVAKRLVQAVQEGGGIMTLRDLETYYARERPPVVMNYRSVQVAAMGLPSSGGIVLQQMLNILYRYDLKNMEEGKRAHLMVETMRRAYKDRALYLGDPESSKPPLEMLLSREYAEKVRGDISMVSATPSRSLTPDLKIHPPSPSGAKEMGGGQTTHFTVADRRGMIVSNTYTLERTFGCKAVAGETGVLMNNEMHDFNLRPGWTSEDGSIGTDPNLIAPGRRMLSSMCPVILMKNNKPYAAFGSPGGRSIINTVLQVIVNLVDLNMSMEDAVRAPRLHHQWFPDRVYAEKALSWDVRKALTSRGHELKEKDRLGDCHAVFFFGGDLVGTMQGVADTRIDGSAAGL